MRLSSVCRLDNGEKVSNVKLPLLDAKYLRGKSSENMVSSGILVNKDDYIILVDGENSGEVFKAPVCGIMGTTFKKLYITTSTYNKYVLYLLKYYQGVFRHSKRGAAIPHLDKLLFANLMVGLPPISEQERIVNEIEKIFSEIDIVKKNQEELSKLKDGLKNKILDLAIRGKLVEQDPNDEPASVLLEKIKVEKAELVKQGKIKKDKHESYIFKGADNRHYEKIGSEVRDITEEIPFDIPNNWSWCRLGNVFDVRDGTHDTPKYYPQGIPLVTSKNLCNGEISYDNVKFISQDDANKINERSFVDNGDILFGMIGTIGKPVIVNKTIEFCIKNVALIKNIFNQDIKYCYYLLLAMEEFMNKNASGGVQPFVSLNYIRNLLIPLPPIKEQERIAYKLNIILDIVMSL